MSSGLISLLTVLLSLLFWWLRRRRENRENPNEQNRKRYAQIDADIARRDSNAASVHSSTDLDELERLQAGKPPCGGRGGLVRRLANKLKHRDMKDFTF